ncbi:MAG: hypothetical protein EZS28_014910 [Streblomastix strix]|uniref:Uncharacterized protein n=1 Tax=Streblomastix strix TaxID=222440 RepID=A0A5J4W4G3_9EUKA|nr:MAG: hypothetical protein EZS28_014910 [Streblomastix strix]
MQLLRMILGKQCKFLSYLRFRHHYEAKIQASKMRKNLNEKSELTDHEDIVIILINRKRFHVKLLRFNQNKLLRIHTYLILTQKYRISSLIASEDVLIHVRKVKISFLTPLTIQKFSHQKKEEKYIDIVMEEPLMRYNSCILKKFKQKEIVRVDDVLIKNVSISNIDNVFWNSFEKLYYLNKDFVRLSDKLESDIGPDDF